MKYWPVPNSYHHSVPGRGQRGSFWEDRGDRRHAGIDIHSPPHSEVLAIEDGMVIKIDVFTSPDQIAYWNITYGIIVKHHDGKYFRYAELENIIVNSGEFVTAGQVMGYVGTTLNVKKIDLTSPLYIQDLSKSELSSMLHLEIYTALPDSDHDYLGGNYFTNIKPATLVDPSNYLCSICNDFK